MGAVKVTAVEPYPVGQTDLGLDGLEALEFQIEHVRQPDTRVIYTRSGVGDCALCSSPPGAASS